MVILRWEFGKSIAMSCTDERNFYVRPTPHFQEREAEPEDHHQFPCPVHVGTENI